MLLPMISPVHLRKKKFFLALCYHRMCSFRSGKIWPLSHLKTKWKILICPPHQNGLFFRYFQTNIDYIQFTIICSVGQKVEGTEMVHLTTVMFNLTNKTDFDRFRWKSFDLWSQTEFRTIAIFVFVNIF